IDFSFLSPGQWTLELFRDGPNADRYTEDYQKQTIPIDSSLKLQISLAPGGGFAGRISPGTKER
ncbi:MAG: glycoside hydrolase family 97 C-terminal domain-containing protein, partial [Acidobacteria bacterium]|nr:glycoside hydrolase family 97 C-terminal domain-containing protein [Acidobacteriota bacterium]